MENSMENLEKLDNAIKELEKQSDDLKEFNRVYAEIAQLKQDISENLRLLKENNQGLTDISKEIEKRLDEHQQKIDEIYKESRAFQRELDSSIVSRLDKHKSDIQVDVRNEGTQIQRTLENALNSNFNSLESKLRDEFSKQTKQINTLKIWLFVLTVISIGLAIGLFIK
jgi:myosin heavy subunit